MDQFQAIISRQGEHGAQAILENWEKHVGIHHSSAMTLEQRWDRFLRATDINLTRIAA